MCFCRHAVSFYVGVHWVKMRQHVSQKWFLLWATSNHGHVSEPKPTHLSDTARCFSPRFRCKDVGSWNSLKSFPLCLVGSWGAQFSWSIMVMDTWQIRRLSGCQLWYPIITIPQYDRNLSCHRRCQDIVGTDVLCFTSGTWGMAVLCRLKGSVIPKALVWSVPCALLILGAKSKGFLIHFAYSVCRVVFI